MIIVKYVSNSPENFVEDVFNIDVNTYSAELAGEIEQLYKRTRFCPDTFVLLYEEEKMIGYINFFPMTKELYQEMMDDNNFSMRDDDIEPFEMQQWDKTKEHDVFIISLVILPEYRDKEAIVVLGNAFLDFLRQKNNSGYYIKSLSGSAVSNGGANFLKRFGAKQIKTLEHGYQFYITNEETLQQLLKSDKKLPKK